ncbi:uncharacterized protein MCYG_06692 [Microsporum canis CBS 113480]|uniref:Uncharacterized protein n=1 Tax=Arthroderma otae (strain ATCC MYA-4605 / CBS 113480) TaxID=554155 RepID=C5FVD9_ARTOC|nr:uncharacterized protein MCYG_06692 [Microsporum canis CBS 113480]EEQ33873.1 predicted protein [Microsporum canis CBS 113480]
MSTTSSLPLPSFHFYSATATSTLLNYLLPNPTSPTLGSWHDMSWHKEMLPLRVRAPEAHTSRREHQKLEVERRASSMKKQHKEEQREDSPLLPLLPPLLPLLPLPLPLPLLPPTLCYIFYVHVCSRYPASRSSTSEAFTTQRRSCRHYLMPTQ